MFFKTMRTSLLLLFSALMLSSCGEYQKLLRSDDVGAKYTAAVDLYKEGKYKKSLKLMEQIVPAYRGKPQAEPLMYRYANTFYELGDFYLAGYQFERFETTYPKSDSVEVAAFKSAKSYYQLSPRYSLDQADTQKAMDKLQSFLNKYPDSERRQEANELVLELRRKLEKKDYEVAKQFLRISDYKAAIEAYENFIADHPGSIFRKNAFLERTEAAYLLAINSVPYKVQGRLKQAKIYYDNYLKYYKEDTELKEDADKLYENIQQRLESSETAIN
ncbi:MAG: outer membrane protein assembly factor BamD [Flavobacteriaceae bacterium]|nr:outer membrane protein assembly factor BamD [Flavobacteriaceae bacterium]